MRASMGKKGLRAIRLALTSHGCLRGILGAIRSARTRHTRVCFLMIHDR